MNAPKRLNTSQKGKRFMEETTIKKSPLEENRDTIKKNQDTGRMVLFKGITQESCTFHRLDVCKEKCSYWG